MSVTTSTPTTTMPIRDVSLFVEVVGRGDPLVLMHGGPGADHCTLLPFRRLSDRFTLIFYDHRCNGRSQGAAVSSMTWENLTADAEALRQRLGFERWAVLGHSFGGHVALEYALRYPASLSHLVLLDTGGDSRWSQEHGPQLLARRGYGPRTVELARRFFNGQIAPNEMMPALLRFGRAYYHDPNLVLLAREMLRGGWRTSGLRPVRQLPRRLADGRRALQRPRRHPSGLRPGRVRPQRARPGRLPGPLCPDGPCRPSDRPIPVAGAATLQVTIQAPDLRESGHQAWRTPWQLGQRLAGGGTTLREVRFAGTFEHVTTFAVGVRTVRGRAAPRGCRPRVPTARCRHPGPRRRPRSTRPSWPGSTDGTAIGRNALKLRYSSSADKDDDGSMCHLRERAASRTGREI